MHRPAPTSNRPAAASAAARALRAALALTLACALCLPATALAAPDAGDAPAEAESQRDANDRQIAKAREAAAAIPAPQVDTAAPAQPAKPGVTRIHVLSFSYMDAILLESDGRFGLVDAAEDSDYPDGKRPLYPADLYPPERPGITHGAGVEQQLVAQLKKVGVTEGNLEFFIGTHPHSDHIGGADTIIETFKPERIYTPEYKDAYIQGGTRPDPTDKAAFAKWTSHPRLWDNLYVYDQMIAAAKDNDAELIQSLTPETARFKLGSMDIEIVNYDEAYKKSPVSDANDFCWGVKVEALGQRAFLAGDINNYNGDEDALAKTLGHVDLLKLGHHGGPGSNSTAYLRSILASPATESAIAVQTGAYAHATPELIGALDSSNARHLTTEEAARDGRPAIVITFAKDGLTTNVDSMAQAFRTRTSSPYLTSYVNGKQAPLSGWVSRNGRWYWFENAASPVEGQWRALGGTWYYLTANGTMATGWAHDGSAYYFFEPSGAMHPGGWLLDQGTWYYLSPSGAMATGWVNLSGTWYYLGDDGRMRTGWYVADGRWYYSDASGAMRSSGWLSTGGAWYWLEPSGAMAENTWKLIRNVWYYLGEGGAMRTGWFQVGGTWYLANGSGAMLTGWQRVGGMWYYLHGSGAMAEGWANLGGTWYYLAPGSGAMHVGWLELDGTWYYLSGSGAMVTGRQIINGKPYVFAMSGAWAG